MASLKINEGACKVASNVDKLVSGFTAKEWDEIAASPKFQELHRKKSGFLIGWWLFSTIFYFLLPIAAGYTTAPTDFFNKQIIGHIPLLYLFALAQYAVCLFIALHYHYWANRTSDRLTRELLAELKAK